MTATDELRRLLDERGVEWMPSAWSAKDETFYKVGDVGYLATELSSGKMKVYIEGYPTPEQTIAATLGSEDTYTCEDVESAFVSGYSLGCLPAGSDPTWDQNEQTIDEHMAEWGWVREESATLGGGYHGFWTHDGTLHIELPKLPESISVRLPDKRDRDVRSARVWQYTLGDSDATPTRQGVGTCKADETDTMECVCDGIGHYGESLTVHVMECSACGGTYEHVNGGYEFCPRCGAKVIG